MNTSLPTELPCSLLFASLMALLQVACGGMPVISGTSSGGSSDVGGASTTGGEEAAHCSNSDALQVVSLAIGGAHTCALMSNGGVRCWGGNDYGQLGDGTTTNSATPPTSDVLTGVRSIAAGGSHTCALMVTGGVRCWGDNNYGQLGDTSNDDCKESFYLGKGITKDVSVPCHLSPPTADVLSRVSAMAAGADHTCALMDSGGVRCWGMNDQGQLGRTSVNTCSRAGIHIVDHSVGYIILVTTAVPCALVPPTGDVLTGARAIAAGSDHTCGLMETGGVRCWGGNSFGQLGDGTTNNSSTPPTSDVLTGAQAIATGGRHTCTLTDAGGVRCWGDNSFGQLGYPGDGTTSVHVVGTCE